MANWQRKLHLKDVWESEDVQLIAKTAAKRLKELKPFGGDDSYLDDEKDDIADEFEGLSEDESADTNDFDSVTASLYDWADTPMDSNWPPKKACWVETSF